MARARQGGVHWYAWAELADLTRVSTVQADHICRAGTHTQAARGSCSSCQESALSNTSGNMHDMPAMHTAWATHIAPRKVHNPEAR